MLIQLSVGGNKQSLKRIHTSRHEMLVFAFCCQLTSTGVWCLFVSSCCKSDALLLVPVVTTRSRNTVDGVSNGFGAVQLEVGECAQGSNGLFVKEDLNRWRDK